MLVIGIFSAPHSSAQEKIVDIKEKKELKRLKKITVALFCDFYHRQTANPHSWVLVSAQPGKRREGLLWARCLPVLSQLHGAVLAPRGWSWTVGWTVGGVGPHPACKTLLTLWIRKRGNGLKLHQGRFKLNIRKDFFTGGVVKHLDRMPEEVVGSTSLEVVEK